MDLSKDSDLRGGKGGAISSSSLSSSSSSVSSESSASSLDDEVTDFLRGGGLGPVRSVRQSFGKKPCCRAPVKRIKEIRIQTGNQKMSFMP